MRTDILQRSEKAGRLARKDGRELSILADYAGRRLIREARPVSSVMVSRVARHWRKGWMDQAVLLCR